MLRRVTLTAVVWAFAWGLCGLGVALVGVATSADTGHVPHELIVFLLGLLGAVIGFLSGIAYALIAGARSLQARGRIVAGATVGVSGIIALMTIGAILNTSSVDPLSSTLKQGMTGILIFGPVAAVLGGLLGAIDSKLHKGAQVN